MKGMNRQVRWSSTMLVLAGLTLAACGGTSTGGNAAGTSSSQTVATGASGAATKPAAGATNAAATSATTGAATGAATAASAAGSTTGGGNNEIVISLQDDPPKLDPAQSSAFVDRQVLNNLCDKLLDLSPDGKIVPMLATEYTTSDDKLTYTFKLRQGVKFHDGTDFNADAVKFNMARYMSEKSPRRNELTSISTIDVVDPQTVKMTLKQSFAPFLSVLTDRSGMMVSPKAAQDMGDDFLAKPVCSGPFKFQERVKGDHITLVKNDNYWQPGLPKASKLTFRIFTDSNTALVNLRSGQVDMTDQIPAKEVTNVQNDTKFKVVNQPGYGYQGMWLNNKQAPFDKKEVRQAVAALIDREALVKVVFGNTATPGNSPFAQADLAHSESDSFSKPDVAKAKDLLSKAGASNVSFTLKSGTSATSVQLAQIIQSMLQQGGIKAEIEKVEFGTLLDQLDKGNYQAGLLGWSGRPDPDQNIYDFVVTGGKNNNSKYSNPSVDEQLKAAREETDPAKRKAIYDKVMATLHDDEPYVYLYHTNNLFGLKAGLNGFTYVPDGIIRAAQLQK
ncbi:MAG: ABC transporter substrate-binding protein [Herpetosiphon sp.]